MKVILSFLLFVFSISTGFSQSCIQEYIGEYKVDTEKTIDALVQANPDKTKEDLSKEISGFLQKVSMEIKSDGLKITMMGRTNEITVTPVASKKDGRACDLKLDVPLEQLPDGVDPPFLTIYHNENNRLMIKSSVGTNNDMDNYIWTKIE